MSNNPRMFSRITSGKFLFDSAEIKSNEFNEAKSASYIKSSLSLWANEFQANFLPPPPRPPFLEELATDGLTSCDLCAWSTNGEKGGYYSVEGHAESSNHMWIVLMIFVSFCSAVVGAIISYKSLKYRRSNSIRAFSARNCAKNQDVSTDQLCNDQKHTQPKKTSIDLKFFMEQDNPENDDSVYATLDDQLSLNSDNLNESYQRTGFSKGDEIPSAPSSAYYSDFSGAAEKQYESIDHFATFEKSSDKNSFGIITLNNNNVISNRLSAISENNFSSHNRSENVNSEYV